jgi:subtilisin family serine protease
MDIYVTKVLPAQVQYSFNRLGIDNIDDFHKSVRDNDPTLLDNLYKHPADQSSSYFGYLETANEVPTHPRYNTFVAQESNGANSVSINLSSAWNLYDSISNKQQVIVALIDTGVATDNMALCHSVWTNPGEIPGDGIDNDGNGYVDDVHGWNFHDNNNNLACDSSDFHGTHTAGIIAADRNSEKAAGVADNNYVKIMCLKALGSQNTAKTSQDIVDAIHYAEANGASICNLSFGSDTYDAKVAKAIRESSMLFVVAAGNGDGSGKAFDLEQHMVFPASLRYDNIISVGNLKADGTLNESSNYSDKQVDIAAPGTDILSTYSSNTYAYMTGTSMAAPVVSGVAAMLLSSHPTWSVSTVRSAILNTAHKTESLKDKTVTGGMLDAEAAMKYAA